MIAALYIVSQNVLLAVEIRDLPDRLRIGGLQQKPEARRSLRAPQVRHQRTRGRAVVIVDVVAEMHDVVARSPSR